jgi:mRNA interferase MazF
MVIERGDVWWADLDEPRGSAPGFRRPVVVVQSDAFNRSRIGTVVVLVVTSNMRLLDAPGNVLLSMHASGLPRDSVVNVSQIVTIDRTTLSERVGQLDGKTLTAISRGVRLVLDL